MQIRILVASTLLSSVLAAQTHRIVVETPEGRFTVRTARSSLQNLDRPDAVYHQILADLRELRSRYLHRLPEGDRQRAEALTYEVEDLVALLRETARFPDEVWVVLPTGQARMDLRTPEEGVPMDPSAFQRLLQALETESFSDDRLELLRTTARENGFTVAQVARIMDLFDFGDDRVEVVRILYPRIVDPENAHLLLSHVEFSDEKEELRRILEQR